MSRLTIALVLARTGWLPWLSIVLLGSAVAIQETATARLLARITAGEIEIERTLKSARDAPLQATQQKSPLEIGLEPFVAALGDRQALTRYIGTVLEEAARSRITLAAADYKLETDRAGGFDVYRVTLPVSGQYPHLRRFVDSVLQRVACAALEEVSFRRDGIGSSNAEAKLHIVFYLKVAAR